MRIEIEVKMSDSGNWNKDRVSVEVVLDIPDSTLKVIPLKEITDVAVDKAITEYTAKCEASETEVKEQA